MTKVRFGVLSTAKIARNTLIPAMERAHNAEVVAVASESEKAKDFAAELGIPKHYESYTELLNDPKIDAVYIPLPNQLHKQWAIEAAKHGKHVLCEKPAALTSQDVEEMAAAFTENNVIFMEAFMYQFHPQHNRVKEIIVAGEIGDVKLIRSTFSFLHDLNSGSIKMQKDLGGGVLYDVGCYCIHASRLITGEEPVEVKATANNHPTHNVDITAAGTLKFESGVVANFDVSFEQPFKAQYEVVGTKGSIVAKHAFRPDNEGGNGVLVVNGEAGQREETVQGDQYKLQVEHFAESVLSNKQPKYSVNETLKNMRVIEQALASARN
ncbi:Gfo/Idh/MocA family protein [Fredinandcohnia onubensis]|uniref:Gfo/Idh/MocA family protein n=1 Tax=Fredinandcohnia onubensis TaxID=1571209 RepID=UPI000C0C0876|nr:Gfo/Idh/MocA family oxidoreductase [Fredinandcohnia onubensis]